MGYKEGNAHNPTLKIPSAVYRVYNSAAHVTVRTISLTVAALLNILLTKGPVEIGFCHSAMPGLHHIRVVGVTHVVSGAVYSVSHEVVL